MVQADRNQPIAERLREVAADEDRPIERFRHSLDPADQIDRWPDDGEVEPIGRADIAITDRADVQRHDDFERRLVGHRRGTIGPLAILLQIELEESICTQHWPLMKM